MFNQVESTSISICNKVYVLISCEKIGRTQNIVQNNARFTDQVTITHFKQVLSQKYMHMYMYMERMRLCPAKLHSFASNSNCKPHVIRCNCNSFGMKRTEVCVFKKSS